MDPLLSVWKLLEECASPDASTVRAAEAKLNEVSTLPGYLPCLVAILREKQSSSVTTTMATSDRPLAVGLPTRQMAAICLKNEIRKRWSLPEGSSPEALPASDCEKVREQLVALYVETATEVSLQRQIGTALMEVAQVDFPSPWKSLVKSIAENYLLTSVPLVQKEAAISALALVLEKYRHEQKSDEVLAELKFHVLPYLEEPLVAVFTGTLSLLNSSGGATTALPCLQIVAKIVEIFQSLISVDLPEFIEDNAAVFFDAFFAILGLTPDPSAQHIPKKTLYALKTDIFKATTLYAQRYPEEFELFIARALQASLPELETATVLVTTSTAESDDLDDEDELGVSLDGFLSSGMKFVGAGARVSWASRPYDSADCVARICERIVLPSARLGSRELEQLEDSPYDFIRRSLEGEGPECESRRSAAVELIKSLAVLHEAEISKIFPVYIKSLFESSSNPAIPLAEQQLYFDSAVHLTIAIMVKSETKLYGVSQVYPIVNIVDLLFSALIKEIQTHENAQPKNALARAAVFKFIATFRNQLEKPVLLQLLPIIVQNLQFKDPLIHTHAAYCLEAVLLTRQISVGVAVPLKKGFSSLTFSRLELRDILRPAFGNLLQILETSTPNEIAMRCLVKLLIFIGPEGFAGSIVEQCIKSTRRILERQCKSSSNPQFDHNLFEALGALVRVVAFASVGAASTDMAKAALIAAATSAIEIEFVPLLTSIVVKEDHDFVPYSLQILALLLDSVASAAPLYLQLFEHLLQQQQWTASTARVPAIVRMLAAYFRKFSLFEVQLRSSLPVRVIQYHRRLPSQIILQRFQYCLNHKKLVSVGLDLLCDIAQKLPFELIASELPTVTLVLLKRLQAGLSSRNVQTACFAILIFCVSSTPPQLIALLKARSPDHSSFDLPNILDKAAPGLAQSFIASILVPNVKKLTELYQKRVALLGLAKLCSSPAIGANEMLVETLLQTCAQLLGVVTASGRQSQMEASPDNLIDDFQSLTFGEEFQGTYNALQSARIPSIATEIPEASSGALAKNVCQNFAPAAARLSGLPTWPVIANALTVN